MSDFIVPTVKIRNAVDYTVINASDYDPKVHVLWEEPAAPPPPPAPLPPPPGPANPLDGLGAEWKDKDAAELKRLAEVIGGRAVENKRQAVEVIEAALKARG